MKILQAPEAETLVIDFENQSSDIESKVYAYFRHKVTTTAEATVFFQEHLLYLIENSCIHLERESELICQILNALSAVKTLYVVIVLKQCYEHHKTQTVESLRAFKADIPAWQYNHDEDDD